jgi:signal transduction histidine kinase
VLQPGTHHLELYFDAIEISSPEKIRLQYRLDGVDSEWLDTGHPAHAIYSNIPAGTHAFHVRACNRDGIWDRAGMVYSITQQPYPYETAWFQLAAVTAGFLLLAGWHRLRLRRAAAVLNARLGERMAERERIARELHDTLLQGIQGVMWRFQAGAAQIPVGEPARQLIESALDRADEVIVEGRDRVKGLRTAEEKYGDLSETFAMMSAELAKEHAIPFQITLQGTPQALNPIVCDDAYQIAREALVNAFRHSLAQKIETEITFARTELRLRVRDNGCGVDSKILEDGGRPGHWGMRGMRERARKIGARLDIWSRPGNGTEVDLRIPASIAYRGGAKGWRWPWSGYPDREGNNS